MKFSEWKQKLETIEDEIHEKQIQYETAKTRREEFLRLTVGFGAGDLATVAGTAEMISKVMEMKNAEDGK